MPIVNVVTNLSRSQLPKHFMPRLSVHIAAALNKDQKLMKWTLETDREMAMGCGEDNHKTPCMMVDVKSIGVFKTPEQCAAFAPKLFDFIVKETTLKESEIATTFGDLEAFRVAMNSKTLG